MFWRRCKGFQTSNSVTGRATVTSLTLVRPKIQLSTYYRDTWTVPKAEQVERAGVEQARQMSWRRWDWSAEYVGEVAEGTFLPQRCGSKCLSYCIRQLSLVIISDRMCLFANNREFPCSQLKPKWGCFSWYNQQVQLSGGLQARPSQGTGSL